MINAKKIIVVMPAYNAEQTLEKTTQDIDRNIVDGIIVVDDASSDFTAKIADRLGLLVYRHKRNLGYGANQKSCYKLALQQGADIVVMVHPDYQYDPRLVPAMSSMLSNNVYDVVLGSRILGSRIASRGMPLWRWWANRLLTFFQNILLGEKLSEYHTGFRAFTKDVLNNLPLYENSNDFIFDNEMLCEAIFFGFRIGEVSCPTRYLSGSSSISFLRAVIYGLGVIRVTMQFLFHRIGLIECRLFKKDSRKLMA